MPGESFGSLFQEQAPGIRVPHREPRRQSRRDRDATRSGHEAVGRWWSSAWRPNRAAAGGWAIARARQRDSASSAARFAKTEIPYRGRRCPRGTRVASRSQSWTAYSHGGCVAAHHLVLAEHVARLLGVDDDAARDHLAATQLVGLIRRRRLLTIDAGCYQITCAGLAAIASELPPPRLDPDRYRHEIGAGWLWLAATTAGTSAPSTTS